MASGLKGAGLWVSVGVGEAWDCGGFLSFFKNKKPPTMASRISKITASIIFFFRSEDGGGVWIWIGVGEAGGGVGAWIGPASGVVAN